jgi:dephospho-CoA kinase
MKVIGITGGMASGKTTVAQMFAAHGFTHFDADLAVHRLMQDDPEMIAAIAEKFPMSLENGHISRRALSEIVARNPDALPILEALIHPRVRAAEKALIENIKNKQGKGLILDIPLLFETGADAQCNLTIAVHVPQAIAKARAFTRPGMTQAKWNRLIARQLSEDERCRRANHVIDATGTLDTTRKQVDDLVAALVL